MSLDSPEQAAVAAVAAALMLDTSPEAVISDHAENHAVVLVRSRQSNGSYMKTGVFLTRNERGTWTASSNMTGGNMYDRDLIRADSVWEGWESPVLDLTVQGWAPGGPEPSSRPTTGWKWASGTAARQVTEVEVASSLDLRTTKVERDDGDFVVLILAPWDEEPKVTAVTRRGDRLRLQ